MMRRLDMPSPKETGEWRVNYYTAEGEEKNRVFGNKQERDDWVRANGRKCLALTKHRLLAGVKHFGV